MKKIFTFFLGICSLATIAAAQKGSPTAITTHNKVQSVFPDLTFDLAPQILLTGGKTYEWTPGSPGAIKMKVDFIIRNVGGSNSVPSKVYAEFCFDGTERQSNEIVNLVRCNYSIDVDIPAIEKGKELFLRREFIFNGVKEQAWGKDLKFHLAIHSTGPGSQKEITTKNNQSVDTPFKIIR